MRWAFVAITAIGALAAVLIQMFREGDNLPTITALLAFVGSVLAYMKSQETHLSVNSRLDQMMEHAEAASLAKGIAQERERADDAREDV